MAVKKPSKPMNKVIMMNKMSIDSAVRFLKEDFDRLSSEGISWKDLEILTGLSRTTLWRNSEIYKIFSEIKRNKKKTSIKRNSSQSIQRIIELEKEVADLHKKIELFYDFYICAARKIEERGLDAAQILGKNPIR